MARSIILLLDSFGIGYAHDAEKFGDSGADTLGHICEWMAANRKSADGRCGRAQPWSKAGVSSKQ